MMTASSCCCGKSSLLSIMSHTYSVQFLRFTQGGARLQRFAMGWYVLRFQRFRRFAAGMLNAWRRLRGHVPLGLQAHSTVGACVCLGFSFAGLCAAAGCKPTARLACVCLGFLFAGYVPLWAASPQHGWRLACAWVFRLRGHAAGLQAHSTVGACVCLGFSFAGSCAAAGCKPTARSAPACLGFSFAGSCAAVGCKPTARLAPACAWVFVCGVMCRCGLQAHSTAPACAWVFRLRGHVPCGLQAHSTVGAACAWVFVCGVMCRCGLQAHSTVGVRVLGFSFAGYVPLRVKRPQSGGVP